MSKAIKAIDQHSVHRICSGQVVLDLATAAKELLENSLDAGATAIDIRFKDYGTESLEVIDNGSGLDPSDYETLALKHYTSKLSKFEDLEGVATFGFRGEALSSLCALATLTVTTSTAAQAPAGFRIEYDSNGQLVSKTSVARSTGLTVQLSNLFYSLPVRHREFKKNIKREFAKALNIIQAYAIICPNVRISASNQIGKGASSKVLTCNANKTIRENIANLFGAKVVGQIMPVDLSLYDATTASGEEGSDSEKKGIKVVGFISKPVWGNGRSSADRQYLYINGRPCNLPKISRALNEIFRSFISNQYPFAVLDFRIPNGEFDVNVSPDKRTIFIHNEKWLSDRFSEQLGLLLEPSRYTLPANDFTASPSTHLEPDQVYDSNDASESDVLRNSADNDPQSHDPQSQDTIVMTVPAIPPNRRSRFKLNDMALNSGRMYIPANTASDGGVPTKRQYSQTTLDMVAIKRKRTVDIKETSESQQQAINTDDEVPLDTQEVSEDEDAFNASLERSIEVELSENKEEIIDEEDVSTAVSDSERSIEMVASEDLDFDASSYPSEQQNSKIHYDGGLMQHIPDPCYPFENDDNQYILETFIPSPSVRYEEITTDHDAIVSTSRPYLGTCNLSTSIDVDATALLEQCRRRTRKEHDQARSKITSTNRVPLMNANVSNTTDNGEATKVLDRVIDKMDFCKMRIIGQFNLGFIIAALNDHDLFIIDQHASDEKFNFETLQQTTQIRGQKLIQPRSIGLTASEEMVAMDNVEILKANGFDIEVDENAPPTQKIKIVSQPTSKNTIFSTKDFEELVFLLSDRPGEMVRCSKTRAMFASRACRKSVMIGDSLGKSQMIKIVQNMSKIDQPWNCPHGRPTMRHLFDMSHSSCGEKSRGMAVKFGNQFQA